MSEPHNIVGEYEIELTYADGETLTGPLFRVCDLVYDRDGQIIGGAVASVLLGSGSTLRFGHAPGEPDAPVLALRVLKRPKLSQ